MHTKNPIQITAVALSALCACSSTPSNTISGSVDGRSFSVAEAAAAVTPAYQGVSTAPGADAGADSGWWATTVFLSSESSQAGGACALAMGLNLPAESAQRLVITVGTVGEYAGPGTYEVGPSSVVANLYQTTSDGGWGAAVAATEGSVTVTAATGSPALDNLAGTFALTFGSNGSFTGSFSAPVWP